MLNFQTSKKDLSLACALAYWCFLCRDTNKSPAMGIETWNYFQSSLVNAAIPSDSLEDFLEHLSKKLVVPHLNPLIFTRIVNPKQIIQRVDIETGEIMEYNKDQSSEKLRWIGWEDVLNNLAPEGITETDILRLYARYPHVIIALVRLRHEEEKELRNTVIDDSIEV